MVPQIVRFWFISRKERLESQQKQALRNRFSRTLLCSNDLFNPGNYRVKLSRKRTSFLDKIYFNYEQLFRPVECTACKTCHCSSIDGFVSPGAISFLSTSDQLPYLWDSNCFGNSTTPTLKLCLSVLKFTHTFPLPVYFVHFRQEYSSLESVFSMSGNCHVSTTGSLSFSEIVFGVVTST